MLSTLTNGYFSPLMASQRFDVAIVEEASMAVLPAIFYAACLGRSKTIMVGDPCQLPSIVQSNEDYVTEGDGPQHLRGRGSGAVVLTVGRDAGRAISHASSIGELVSDLFYAGRLKHGGDLAMRERIAAREPHAGAPLVVWIPPATRGASQAPGATSRINVATAANLCVDLAIRAVRAGAESVAIITPYVDQARAIRARLKEQAGASRRCDDTSNAAPCTASRDRSGMS